MIFLSTRFNTIHFVHAVRQTRQFRSAKDDKVVARLLDFFREIVRQDILEALIDEND